MTIYVFTDRFVHGSRYVSDELKMHHRDPGIWILQSHQDIHKLRGRRFEVGDELHFLADFSSDRTWATQAAGEVSMTLCMSHPAWPKVVWMSPEPMYDFLPFLEAPVHDVDELEDWLAR